MLHLCNYAANFASRISCIRQERDVRSSHMVFIPCSSCSSPYYISLIVLDVIYIYSMVRIAKQSKKLVYFTLYWKCIPRLALYPTAAAAAVATTTMVPAATVVG